MRTTLYPFFSHEFITVSGESRPGLPPDEAARDLFARFTTELHAHGLSLDDTVRTRLWGRDRAARDGSSRERMQILSDKARSAKGLRLFSYLRTVELTSSTSPAAIICKMTPNASVYSQILGCVWSSNGLL